MNSRRWQITHFVESLYQKYAYPVYSSEVYQNALSQNICLTYGEILTPSLCALLDRFQFRSEDVWLDLGSGMGKTLLTTLLSTSIQTLIGYEANDTLTNIGQTIFQNVADTIKQDRNVILKTANFLEEDLGVASVAYICSTCFTESLLDEIAIKLNQSQRLHTVISLKPIAKLRLAFQRTFRVECSWDSALVYVYSS